MAAHCSTDIADRHRIALDVHAHLAPLREEVAVEGVEWRDGVPRIDGTPLAETRLLRPAELLRWMDTHGVAHAWVSIPPPLYRPALTKDDATRWAEAMNEGLVAACSVDPARLSPLLHLPVRYPAAACTIAARRIARGWRRFALPAGDAQQSIKLSGGDYESLWSALEAGGAFVFLHPQRGCDARLDEFNLHNLLGTPGETALAAAHLAFAGVPRRHPRIVFCLAHAGGTLPMLLGRMERGQQTGTPGGEPVRAALRLFCIDCIAHDRSALELAATAFDEGLVLFGSDWPFAMGLPEPATQLEGVRRDLLDAMFRDNPRRLFRRLDKG